MTTTSLLSILTAFHREKLSLRQRHVAVARQISEYNFNNTYQYLIAREDVHLSWLEAAIAELGGTPESVAEPELPARKMTRKDTAKEFAAPLASQDAREAEAFVLAWRPRLSEVTNARHRNMMNVVLGETLEHKRFFDLMVLGNENLLGRRANGPGPIGTGDGVLPVRWIE